MCCHDFQLWPLAYSIFQEKHPGLLNRFYCRGFAETGWPCHWWSRACLQSLPPEPSIKHAFGETTTLSKSIGRSPSILRISQLANQFLWGSCPRRSFQMTDHKGILTNSVKLKLYISIRQAFWYPVIVPRRALWSYLGGLEVNWIESGFLL